ncbi:hypothetical protein A3C98_04875 [Candidatus Roizmanbacteria bacterium RIFCSPHIGHO2_02_FULL_37_15]|uniref:Uncharacterized protein n=1 Tax=Candidatus Roizmanbacteria bacterium RIFCSPLOWO2_01_FULL_37_16 TaxID=1802058 RepID=A0A1F7IQN8_9BACT|nr:MAG: hypothetical protein A2859_03380 [Candidatus Roizmanbacteria bacterium RIFCSPHIGHO2_01_FULL_37_16b]OGK22405.1 MAG: hypothetical protein A3C98_04875 [Candidatus Roizmanbacteria bacterium RIFCSPHIGHO2_02_FULL_37_15]OGK32129.1 MAG: hypothetical protein A3F57_03605 [Candidatus Roizmanbacteria bacterium RIFCSPHIGHO2_12_FULL_36_11]OGK45675.1 MAG: hypothetical protein A3B40_04310 [Candidatus Roizmanbacteria bacterium RIFCSPLOWO2_01_FULL_37_16]OGK57853.1 MAG: hypothetical protein A3I50_02290 [C
MLMNILFETSIIASFLAGMIALFAPCCITFMLPAYFAYTFKQKRAIILMTFIFFFGVATILVPIGLGVAYLTQLFKGYHTQVFYLGGILMLFLSYLAFSGKKFSMPFKQLPLLKKHDVLSIYVLGLFSGLASSCCAPVLAGVLTLSALSLNLFQALILTLVYVFGMVFPLFILAYFWDSFNWSESRLVRGIMIRFKIFEKEFSIHSSNLLTGIIFLIIGIYILYLAATNQITSVSPSQSQFIAYLTIIQKKILEATKNIPDWIFLSIILIMIVIMMKKIIKED